MVPLVNFGYLVPEICFVNAFEGHQLSKNVLHLKEKCQFVFVYRWAEHGDHPRHRWGADNSIHKEIVNFINQSAEKLLLLYQWRCKIVQVIIQVSYGFRYLPNVKTNSLNFYRLDNALFCGCFLLRLDFFRSLIPVILIVYCFLLLLIFNFLNCSIFVSMLIKGDIRHWSPLLLSWLGSFFSSSIEERLQLFLDPG